MDEEAELRRRQAVELNDDVVQGLVVARMAVEIGDLERAAEAIDRTLDAARSIVAELLAAGGAAEPGSLVRRRRVPGKQDRP